MMASPARLRRISPCGQPVGQLPVDPLFYLRQFRQQGLGVHSFLRRLLPMRYCSREPRGSTRERWMARRSEVGLIQGIPLADFLAPVRHQRPVQGPGATRWQAL